MARPRKPTPPPKEVAPLAPVTTASEPIIAPVVVEAPAVEIHAVIPDVAESAPADDGLVSVRYFDNSTFTFNLHVAEGIVSFVDGAARVTPALAKALKAGGYIA